MKPAVSAHWRLSTLFDDLGAELHGADVAVEGLALDSREVEAGECFLALKGSQQRGAHFVPQALRRGASAIALEPDEDLQTGSVPRVLVPDLRAKVGVLAGRLFGNPSHALEVVAVTGTNGKTTVAHLCAQAFGHLLGPCGYIGTLGMGLPEQLTASGMTTPDPLPLQAEFARMRDAGIRAVVIEASSHALAQSRLNGTRILTAVFTGLGHDHLDYHADQAAYLAAKRLLFTHPGLGHAVANLDDPVAGDMLGAVAAGVERWGFSLGGDAAGEWVEESRHLRLWAADYQRDHSLLEVGVGQARVQIRTHLTGDFNAQNLLACLAVLLAHGVGLDKAATALASVHPVEGRMERLGGRGRPDIFIDFAHSPDSLERVLRVLRGFHPRRLICVFGCGGDRDRSKRAPMGRIATSLADQVFLTSDNPRSETPAAIAQDVLSGVEQSTPVSVIDDRTQAILSALGAAGAEDIVLVAGKGHEKTQEIAGVKYPCSDRAIVQQWLQAS
ncbi:MAG: UDP-N-acetylmuramoyl-L-alanyl-D-glutamate--2,6-diaminopimelate ligase [Gammaproteobacteria bacterium]|nr:UDP-N-acetylmuramoyl-L-alanyl-D-glutamate--2,6-diaminopimelate ligase [Gammaproteobacteria bacterium]